MEMSYVLIELNIGGWRVGELLFLFRCCLLSHSHCNGSKRVYLRRDLINSLCGSLSIYRDRHRKRKRGRRRERPSGGKASHFPFISNLSHFLTSTFFFIFWSFPSVCKHLFLSLSNQHCCEDANAKQLTE